MSQIFDALQRSEIERNGKDPKAVSDAIGLLERTEKSSVASRAVEESRHAKNETVVAESATADAITGSDAIGRTELAGGSAVTPLKDLADLPAQCDSLTISVSADSHLVALPENDSPAKEAFHLLGVRLRHLRRQQPLKKILITSTIPQEGKSVVSANLACTLSLATQQKVLLLEGDVRRPTLSKIFGIANKPGICDWLSDQRPLARSMYRLDGPGIWIFPAGNSGANSLELLQSGGATAKMEQVMSWFDWVIIDSPPILPLADTSVWTNMADGILLVTRQGITRKRQLKRGLEALGTQKLIGAILNSARNIAPTDYYYRPNKPVSAGDADD
jgi:capsular exopolysaccharide synthesis family protein